MYSRITSATDVTQAAQGMPHCRLRYDAEAELARLEQLVEQGLQKLNAACTAMRRKERELQRFLAEYHAQLGPLMDELASLQQQISVYDEKIHDARKSSQGLPFLRQDDALLHLLQQELPHLPERISHESWEEEIRAIHERVAALYRQDAPRGRYSTQVLQLLEQACGKRDIWALRAMEHRLVEHALEGQDSPHEKLARLRERFDAIMDCTSRAAYRSQWLESTDAWRMKQRIEENRYLVDVIIHRVKQRIEQTRQLLVRKKIEHRAIAC